MCFLSNNIYDYTNVSQGKITVPGMDDGEECQAMDVSLAPHFPLCYFPISLTFTVFSNPSQFRRKCPPLQKKYIDH